MSEIEIEEVPKFYRRSVFTNSLIERLEKANIGDVITDEELTKICKKDTRPNKNGYGNLKSALRYLLNNKKMVFERIREADAIKRLNDSEVVESASTDLGNLHKRTKTVRKKAGSVDRTKLEKEEHAKLIVVTAQLGFLELITKKQTQKKLAVKNLPEHFKPDLNKIKWEW